jgi:TIR domain
MRVFISYASENRPIVEPIVHSIRARGHKVFFDKHDLPPGQSYEEQIEAAIARSDVFVFLVSPHSVEQGGFARTELRMAEQKWPRPAGRVLPVMLAPTDLSTVPA